MLFVIPCAILWYGFIVHILLRAKRYADGKKPSKTLEKGFKKNI